MMDRLRGELPWNDVFFFQAEDGIRYYKVTGVQTCALPICLTNLDVLLAKTFTLTERFRLQFRAESFNVSNTPAFGNPAANINAAGVGRITSAGGDRKRGV